MANYEDWLRDFLTGKTEVPTQELSDRFAVHSIRRYLEDGKETLWETAITYTGRLVVRSGRFEADGVTLKWGVWTTKHDIEVPKVSVVPRPIT